MPSSGLQCGGRGVGVLFSLFPTLSSLGFSSFVPCAFLSSIMVPLLTLLSSSSHSSSSSDPFTSPFQTRMEILLENSLQEPIFSSFALISKSH